MVMPGQIDRALREALIHELDVLAFNQTATDEYNAPSGDWEATETVRALVKHYSPSVDDNRQETMKQRYTVIVPPDVTVDHTMRLQWDSAVLEIETTEDIYYPLTIGRGKQKHHIRIRALEVTAPGGM